MPVKSRSRLLVENAQQAKKIEAMKYVSERADHKIAQQAEQLKVFVEALILIRMVAKTNPPDPLILQTAEKALLPPQQEDSTNTGEGDAP